MPMVYIGRHSTQWFLTRASVIFSKEVKASRRLIYDELLRRIEKIIYVKILKGEQGFIPALSWSMDGERI